MRQESALNVDAPVTLDELLDRTARETLVGGARDLGIDLSVVDRDGNLVAGIRPPQPALDCKPEFDPILVEHQNHKINVLPLIHEGDTIGIMTLEPFFDDDQALRIGTHFSRIADAFIIEGMKRAMSARMHMATVEEANRELTEKNRRLAQAVERLQEADRVKSNFLATVSHELRTPLTSVIGYSEMLLEGIAGELNEEQREYVRTVMEKGDQLLVLITGILDISRMEAGQMKFEKAPFELDEVVGVALSTVAPNARRKKINLSCDLPVDLPKVIGDRDKVRQVVLNLLNNSIKFTPEGGTVAIRAEEGALSPNASQPGVMGIRVLVQDSGIGVAPEYHQRVFDPFFQVDNSSTREYGGTGLGLSIVKRFIEAHGGNVWLESREGGGATFYFTLPLAPPT
jgi:two-component system sensor histidine kinase BarA